MASLMDRVNHRRLSQVARTRAGKIRAGKIRARIQVGKIPVAMTITSASQIRDCQPRRSSASESSP